MPRVCWWAVLGAGGGFPGDKHFPHHDRFADGFATATHRRVLKTCEEEFEVFLTTMEALGEKLGPLLLQFGKFDKYARSSLETIFSSG
jgi:hypothetical protein